MILASSFALVIPVAPCLLFMHPLISTPTEQGFAIKQQLIADTVAKKEELRARLADLTAQQGENEAKVTQLQGMVWFVVWIYICVCV